MLGVTDVLLVTGRFRAFPIGHNSFLTISLGGSLRQLVGGVMNGVPPMSVLTQNENLISCPDCSGSVSRRAVECPHCGAPFVDVPAHQATRLHATESPASAVVPRSENAGQRKDRPQWLVPVIAAVMVALAIVGVANAAFLAPQTPDYTEQDLKGLDFSGQDLREGLFANANLSNTDLSGADLSGADLTDAHLKGTNLSGADLSGADLTDANLKGTNLSGADLEGADLKGAEIRSVDLGSVDLSHADLSGTELSDVDLSDTDLTGAELTRVETARASGTPAVLPDGWAFVNGHLAGRGADLDDADLSGVDLTNVDLTDASLQNANLAGTNLTNAHLKNTWLVLANLTGAQLTDADLEGAHLRHVDLTDTDLNDAYICNTEWVDGTVHSDEC